MYLEVVRLFGRERFFGLLYVRVWETGDACRTSETEDWNRGPRRRTGTEDRYS